MTERPTFPEMKRPLPSFEQWLDDHGDGSRGDGFEALADLAMRTQAQTANPFSPDEMAFLRLWQGLSVAVVELCNIEHQHGQAPADTIRLMPRALAAAAFYSVASVAAEDSPWRSIAKLLIEEFRFGAKCAADQYTERLARDAEAKP